MNYLFIFLDQLRNLGALIIAELLLVWANLPAKKNVKVRLAVCLLVCFAFVSFYMGLYRYFYDFIGYISIAWYILIGVISGAVVAVCFEIKYSALIWVMLSAYAVQHIVYVAQNEIVFQGLLNGAGNRWLELLAFCAVCAAVYVVFYRIFRDNTRYLDRFFIYESVKEKSMMTVFYTVFIVSTFVNQLNAVNGDSFNYLSAASDLFTCAFVLVVQYVGLTTLRLSSEKYITERLFSEEKRQYEEFKRSVDYINIKCHDLKHEIARIQRKGCVDTERMDRVASELQLYDAFAKTGNETLDILLTDKNLTCLSKNIALTYMADASSMGFMDEADIYSLFGNMLDNAIEYLETVGSIENRFIRLFIRPKGQMLLVHSENYFEGTLETADGLPATTKGDIVLHGFGTKSMKTTVEKYGGSFKISAGDGLYNVDFYFPVK